MTDLRQQPESIKVALIIAVGLVLAALISGGVYTIVPVHNESNVGAYRMNRFTGTVYFMANRSYLIGPLPEHSYPTATPEATP